MPTGLKAVTRRHAADDVFDQLAAAILRRELVAGSPLPPERELAARFDVSPLIARQAIHRLAELGLVRVRQGGATLVCDPDEACDVRVIGLLYGAGARLAPSKEDDADVLTKQVLQGFCLLELAELRGDDAAMAALATEVDAMAAAVRDAKDDAEAEAALARFDEPFWRGVAAATRSRIFRLEVGFWYGVLVRRPSPPPRPIPERVAFYREIARKLSKRDGAAAYYLDALRPWLETLSQTGATRPAPRKRGR